MQPLGWADSAQSAPSEKQENTMPTQGGNKGNDNSNRNESGNRGFASMDDDKQRKIAQKGGEAVSQDREHMSEIGRKGGEQSRGGGSQGGNQGGNRGGSSNQGGRNS
jgi:general stress protein YciG